MNVKTDSLSLYEHLYRLRRELTPCGLNAARLIETALKFLHREIGVTSASVFLVGERGDTLKEVLRLGPSGDIDPGGREEPLSEGSAMYYLLAGEQDVEVVSAASGEDGLQTLLVNLNSKSCHRDSLSAKPTIRWNPRFQGILEVTSHACLDKALLQGCAEELGEWLGLTVLGESIQRQSTQIQSFSELSWLFVTSLRLEDRLRLILEGIQKLFGFDRIRLYLVDASGLVLGGELEADLDRSIQPINFETYPINVGEFRGLVEILWQNLRHDPWARILEQSLSNHDKVLYLPLKVQNKEIGVLVVDNLISQEPISQQVRHFLQSFAGQIALAVDNARLFAKVEQYSLYDTLSSLPNRRYFEQRFNEELYRAYRHSQGFALCLMDLDFFKEINDTFGHQMGDRAIEAVGQAVKSAIRQSDFAARWGGDEISILLGETNEQDACAVAGRILQAIREIRLIYPSDPPKEIRLTASMGIALYPKDGSNLEALMNNADQALYHMKFRGRNGFIFFSQISEPNSQIAQLSQPANGASQLLS
ncbi:MAG: sensor domain-containing diguanylate cyclase [Elusimicrobia bacterium]|nr:sensor domain-containing diguanylate cyclase [Elusimicrobiota bacterium]